MKANNYLAACDLHCRRLYDFKTTLYQHPLHTYTYVPLTTGNDLR